MTASWHTLTDIAIRTSVVYLTLLVGLRLTGQRQLGQMSSFDLVLLLIISNAVQNAMVGPDTSLVGGLVAAGVLIVWHQGIDRVRRYSRSASRLIAGEGIMLINNGTVLVEHVAKAGLTMDELLQALREHGVGSATDVRLAVLEPDGAVSVIRFDDLKPEAHNQPHHRIRAIRRGEDR
ncbi:MAG TPA: YetF domain-containing protein [Gemmatimonadales bacterium]|nr:YetF domain-containing protein [Gemmatimonadales bacterium]